MYLLEILMFIDFPYPHFNKKNRGYLPRLQKKLIMNPPHSRPKTPARPSRSCSRSHYQNGFGMVWKICFCLFALLNISWNISGFVLLFGWSLGSMGNAPCKYVYDSTWKLEHEIGVIPIFPMIFLGFPMLCCVGQNLYDFLIFTGAHQAVTMLIWDQGTRVWKDLSSTGNGNLSACSLVHFVPKSEIW